jgi:hypothetical protein
LAFFWVSFWPFLGKGSSKTPPKSFYKKSMSKGFYQKIGKNPKQFFLDFVYHIFGRFSARGARGHKRGAPRSI